MGFSFAIYQPAIVDLYAGADYRLPGISIWGEGEGNTRHRGFTFGAKVKDDGSVAIVF